MRYRRRSSASGRCGVLAAALACALAACGPAPQDVQPFITEEEAAMEDAPPAPKKRMARGVAPAIEVDRPDVSVAQTLPVEVVLRFEPAEGIPVDPETFEVKYVKFVTIDLTERLGDVEHELGPDGFRAVFDGIPSGKHRLRMSVADERGRVGATDVSFRVE